MADTALAPPIDSPTAVPPPRAASTPRSPVSWVLRVVALGYVGLLVLVPVVVVFYRTFAPGLSEFFKTLKDPLSIHAYEVTAVVAGTSVVINTIFGVTVAILMARYHFWGKRLLSAFIDLPVAVSPIVVGLALLLVYGYSGWFGPGLQSAGFTIIGAKPGMVFATVFVSLPLVVRAVLPVLEQAGTDQEQAAESLGANAVARFRRITLPLIRPALTYGVVLSVARCIGEYGAVLVVSNNIIGQTETVTLKINNDVTQDFNSNGAYALTFILMMVAFLAIVIAAIIRRRSTR